MYRIDKIINNKVLADLFEITIGAILMGAALSVFFVPFMIASGGVSGIATVIHYLSGIRTGVLIIAINIPIFVLGLINFNLKFLLRSLYGTLVLSVAADLLSVFALPISDPILACVFGGAIMGVGIALVIKSGGTTGGTDVIVLLIRKALPDLSVGRLFLIIDGIIVVFAGVVFKSWETMLYSAAAIYISSHVTDAILEGLHLARLVYIMSDKEREITDAIYSKMNRGVTGMNSVSMYTGKKKMVLLCAIRKHEVTNLKKIIYSVDSEAFVIIADANAVMGEGFDSILNS